jgi:hypothetical protein
MSQEVSPACGELAQLPHRRGVLAFVQLAPLGVTFRGPETIRPRNSSTDLSRRSMTSKNNWFGVEPKRPGLPGTRARTSPYGQLSASENRDPGLRRRRWS